MMVYVKKLWPIVCEQCGEVSHNQNRRQRYCNQTCMGMARRGPGNPNWGGGKSLRGDGYVEIPLSAHPRASSSGRILEHIVVMEGHLQRQLEPGETVHHINGVKNDNRAENLHLFESNSAHTTYHAALRPPPPPKKLCFCGRTMIAKRLCDKHYRRMRKNKRLRAVWDASSTTFSPPG
jgi:hypothetical protein